MDKNLIKGKILLIIGMIFLFISLITYSNSYRLSIPLALIGWLIAVIGAYFLGKSKNYKNPLKIETSKDVVKTSLLVGLSAGIFGGILIAKSLLGIIVFVILSVVFFYIFFYLYHKIKDKKK